uniref:F-box domain-containing protein n=1 Tax=Caenorhabditis tropicalis TaxID=1561998 RepID=A0A1I7TH74_9PELO
MTTFPLFQLPLLAMENVLCIMNTHQLILLSLVSSRAKRAVTNFARFKPIFSVHLEISVDPLIRVFTENEQWIFCWTKDKTRIGYDVEADIMGVTHELRHYSKKPVHELVKTYDYIKGVLRCQIEEVYFDLSLYPSLNELFTDWLCSQQRSIANMDITSNKEGFEHDLKYVLNNITVTDEIEAMNVIMDLPHEETTDPDFIGAFNKQFHIPDVEKWFDVKRSDGKVATVGYEFVLMSIGSTC